jgi:hypothetical protein
MCWDVEVFGMIELCHRKLCVALNSCKNHNICLKVELNIYGIVPDSVIVLGKVLKDT